MSDFLSALQEGISGGFTGNIYWRVNLLFFSIRKDFSISIPVFNYTHVPSWPAGVGGPGNNPFPASTVSFAVNPNGGR